MVDMSFQEPDRPEVLNLAERIRRLANGRTTIDVAQFQFIALNEIRARYGVRWNEKRERVQTVARNFIVKRIAPEDVLIPGADGFLVVFGSRTGHLADTTAQRISQELNTFFIGAAEMDDDIRFEARHRSMSVDDFAQAFGDLIAEDHPPAPQMPRFKTAHGEVPMGFTPVWDSKRGALTTYFVTPLDSETGLPLDWDHSHHRHTDMDELKLRVSEEAMRRLFSTGRKAFVGVALHVSTLNSQHSLQRLFAAMSKFDRKLSKFRVLRISGVEPGYPRIYLEDIMRTLRSSIPNIAIGFNWMEPDVVSALNLHPAAIGFTLPPGSLNHHAKVDVFARIHDATSLARLHGVPLGIEGDIAPEHAQRFAMEGVQLMASLRIWPVRPELSPAEIWSCTRLADMAKLEGAA
jgi:hypothetical protein